MSIPPTTPAQNPVALLQEQVLRLSEIYQAQQEQIYLLREQNERLAMALRALASHPPSSGLTRVQVEHIDMRFSVLFNFIFKLIWAYLLAGLVVALILSPCLILSAIWNP